MLTSEPQSKSAEIKVEKSACYSDSSVIFRAAIALFVLLCIGITGVILLVFVNGKFCAANHLGHVVLEHST